MEQAEAGSGLQDMPIDHSMTNGTVDHTIDVRPEALATITNSYEKNTGRRRRSSPDGTGVESIALCASPGDFAPRHRQQTPERESVGGMMRKGVVDHQLGLSLNLVLLAAMTFIMFPSLRQTVEGFFWLQYPTATSGQFAQGPRDLYLVVGFVVIFTGLRAACLDYLLLPLAVKLGIRQKKAKVRFAEQAYLLLYYIVYWTWGVMAFVQDTPVSDATTFKGFVNDLLISLWRDFPRLTISASLKLYYLSQTAFWVQQIFVINIEERRKDHWQMFTHHIVTVGLLVFSYGYRQMRAGNAVLVLMDVVDLIFPAAKILRYLGWQTACDAMFGLFVVTWFLARHLGFLSICWSIYAHVSHIVFPYGTYSTVTAERISSEGGDRVLDNLLQPLLNSGADTVAFNPAIRSVFLGLLGGLQLITIGWFFMIIRVVIKVLQGHPADDSRSDDEGGEDEDVPMPTPKQNGVPYKLRDQQAPAGAEQRYIEVEASSDDPIYISRPSSSTSKQNARRKGKGGISSGLNLGEHKEILNRIGCLSDEQLARERELREAKENGSPRPHGSARRK